MENNDNNVSSSSWLLDTLERVFGSQEEQKEYREKFTIEQQQIAPEIEEETKKKLEKQVQKAKKTIEQKAQKFFNPKEFKIEGKTFYIVEGDILLSKEEKEQYDKDLVEQKKSPKYKECSPPTTLLGEIGRDGKPKRWNPSIVVNLTYWIDINSFPGHDKSTIIVRMREACKDWERTCGVRFKQVDRDDSPLFKVIYLSDDPPDNVLAMAFFPGDPIERRVLWVFPPFYDTDFSQTGILRHEIGHILGFRHEHIRDPRIGGESLKGVFSLTGDRIDRESVMHYFFAGIGGTRTLHISYLDRVGAQKYYGMPLVDFNIHSV